MENSEYQREPDSKQKTKTHTHRAGKSDDLNVNLRCYCIVYKSKINQLLRRQVNKCRHYSKAKWLNLTQNGSCKRKPDTHVWASSGDHKMIPFTKNNDWHLPGWVIKRGEKSSSRRAGGSVLLSISSVSCHCAFRIYLFILFLDKNTHPDSEDIHILVSLLLFKFYFYIFLDCQGYHAPPQQKCVCRHLKRILV